MMYDEHNQEEFEQAPHVDINDIDEEAAGEENPVDLETQGFIGTDPGSDVETEEGNG